MLYSLLTSQWGWWGYSDSVTSCWTPPSSRINSEVLEIPIGKYFTIQRYLFFFSPAITFVNLEDYSDFSIEMLIIRNELQKKRVRASMGKKETSHTSAKVPRLVLCRPGVTDSECYCWKGPQRIVYIQVSWGPQRWRTSWAHSAVQVDNILGGWKRFSVKTIAWQ